jgi:hypothetical protein
MPEENKAEDSPELQPSSSRVILGVIIAVVVLGGLTYAAYMYSNRQSGTVLPAGYKPTQVQVKIPPVAEIDCNTTNPVIKTHNNFYIKCDNYQESATTKWNVYKDPAHGIQLDLPSDLKTTIYANGIGFPWRTIQPAGNLLISYEFTSARPGAKVVTGEEYPKTYWKQFGGLTGVKSLVPYTTKNSLSGWQAVYIYFGNDTPTVDTFFEDPSHPGDFAHFSKGVLSDEVYKKLMDSFIWITRVTPTPAPAAVATPAPAAPTQ